MCLTHVSVRIKQCLSLLCSATRAWNFTWFIILSEIIRIIENGGVVQICYVLLFCRGEHQFILICQHCFYWIRIYNKTQNQYSEKKMNNLFQMCWKKKFYEKFDSISCPKIRFVKLDQERNYDINKSPVWRKRFVTISKICLKNSFIQKLFNSIQLVFLVLFLQKSKLYT